MTQRIDYEQMLRTASIDIVKKILKQVSQNGFFKKQHLYITFSLKHPGVKIEPEIEDTENTDELTIVLQYEYWDLKVDDYGFSVGVAFETADASLYIPYSSLISFEDPSENFCLNFVPDLSDVPQTVKSAIGSTTTSNSKIISLDAFRRK